MTDNDEFVAWVRWRGPYRTKRAWETAAKEFDASNDRVRLYLAIGRWKLLSIAFSRPLYLGLNARDSDQSTLADRIKKHINPQEARAKKHYQISGLLNEYWLGEVMTRWHVCQERHENADNKLGRIDTASKGLTADIEKSLIFCLAPIINDVHVKNPPHEFSFQIINEAVIESKWRRLLRIRTRFEQLVCNFYRYARPENELIYEDISISMRKKKAIENIKKSRAGRTPPEAKYEEPFAYRIFEGKKFSG